MALKKAGRGHKIAHIGFLAMLHKVLEIYPKINKKLSRV